MGEAGLRQRQTDLLVIVLELPDAECKVTMIKIIDHDLISTLCTAEIHRMFPSTPL